MWFEKQNTVKSDVKRKLESMPNWKGTRPDKIHGFWLKSFTDVHEALATVLNKCIKMGDGPGWLEEGRNILAMKNSKKGADVGIYRPITYLNLIRNLLAKMVSDKTWSFRWKQTITRKTKRE